MPSSAFSSASNKVLVIYLVGFAAATVKVELATFFHFIFRIAVCHCRRSRRRRLLNIAVRIVAVCSLYSIGTEADHCRSSLNMNFRLHLPSSESRPTRNNNRRSPDLHQHPSSLLPVKPEHWHFLQLEYYRSTGASAVMRDCSSKIAGKHSDLSLVRNCDRLPTMSGSRLWHAQHISSFHVIRRKLEQRG